MVGRIQKIQSLAAAGVDLYTHSDRFCWCNCSSLCCLAVFPQDSLSSRLLAISPVSVLVFAWISCADLYWTCSIRQPNYSSRSLRTVYRCPISSWWMFHKPQWFALEVLGSTGWNASVRFAGKRHSPVSLSLMQCKIRAALNWSLVGLLVEELVESSKLLFDEALYRRDGEYLEVG